MGQGVMTKVGGQQLKTLRKTCSSAVTYLNQSTGLFRNSGMNLRHHTELNHIVCCVRVPTPATSWPQHNSSKQRLRSIQHAAMVQMQISGSTVANNDHKHVWPANSWKINVHLMMMSRHDCSRIHLWLKIYFTMLYIFNSNILNFILTNCSYNEQ